MVTFNKRHRCDKQPLNYNKHKHTATELHGTALRQPVILVTLHRIDGAVRTWTRFAMGNGYRRIAHSTGMHFVVKFWHFESGFYRNTFLKGNKL